MLPCFQHKQGNFAFTPLLLVLGVFRSGTTSNKDELSEDTLRGVSLIVFGSPRERFLQEEVIRVG